MVDYYCLQGECDFVKIHELIEEEVMDDYIDRRCNGVVVNRKVSDTYHTPKGIQNKANLVKCCGSDIKFDSAPNGSTEIR